MRTLHLVSHTHWDREWYRTFQQFRLRLVHLVDGLLDLLENDPDYKYFTLDGQTIVLDDYLVMRPEAEPVLREHIRTGRLLIGPWHILPDMFLVSPEAHIRNLLAGDREARRFGQKMMIGYMPDSFGHIGQMPQILRGFGIENACLWRGLDDQPAEFWWQSPDGSRVLMLYLRDSYSSGASLNARDPRQFTEQVRQAAESLAPYSAVDDLLVMYGTDHMEPPCETSSAIRLANDGLDGDHLVHSNLPAYFDAVQSQVSARKIEIPTVTGELRSCKRSHLLPGVLSTRMWIKQRNHLCENLLEKWAEPFSTFASMAAQDHRPGAVPFRPASIVRQAWQLLMECHPHDSICGCSVDQVHDEMRVRFDQVEQIGEEITVESLTALAAAVDTQGLGAVTDAQSAITVFNPSSAARTDVVTAEVALPPGVRDFEIVDEGGRIIPRQSARGDVTNLMSVRVRREELGGMLAMVNEGRAGNLAIQDLRFERNGAELHVEVVFAENASPRLDIWNAGQKAFQDYLNDSSIEAFLIHARSPESAHITFTARDVPGLGWSTFYARAKDSTSTDVEIPAWVRLLTPLAGSAAAQRLATRLAAPAARPPYIIENESLSVEFDAASRTLTVTDKTSGQVYRGLNRFTDGGDCGDQYNFCPPPIDSTDHVPALRRVSITRGPVQQKMVITLALSVPAGLSPDRKSRSKTMRELPITTTITLTNGVPRVDVHTQIDNHAKDHRLRVHFPLAIAEAPGNETGQSQSSATLPLATAVYDGHFEVVERPIGNKVSDPTWIEQIRPEVPQRAFTSVADGRRILTVANRGLPEVEVIPAASDGIVGPEIAVTLLRCVGWLSRDDFTTRKGHAGPFLEAPGAQMPGTWEFDYSIIVGQPRTVSYQQAWNFESPLRDMATGIHAGVLPACGSMVSVDNPAFAISALKQREDGKGWIVRGYNIGDEEIQVSLTPWRAFKRVEQVNMAEESVRPLEPSPSGAVTIQPRGHEVITLSFT